MDLDKIGIHYAKPKSSCKLTFIALRAILKTIDREGDER